MKERIFISSVQKELAAERRALRDFVRGDPVGSGTLDVISGCQRAQLPEPEFFRDGDQFVLRLWREWLTADVLAGLRLHERQAAALPLLRQQRRITTAEYQETTGASRATAKRDLEDLVAKGLLVPAGAGRGAHYELARNRLTNGSIGSSPSGEPNGSETARTARRGRRRAGDRSPARSNRKKSRKKK